MASITIVFQGPMKLNGYDSTKSQTKQVPSIPASFLEIMEVREDVYVREQKVPISEEADSDDPRCCHWVAYAMDGFPQPVATVRVVPFPHEKHPTPGSNWDPNQGGSSADLSGHSFPPFTIERATSLHDGKEAYIKIGRLAVLERFRKQGIADKLVKTLLDWAKTNPTFFNKNVPGVNPEQTQWNGLICVHAQEYLAGAWAKWGFKVDEKMGKWTEAGIPHVGMFMRVDIAKAGKSPLSILDKH